MDRIFPEKSSSQPCTILMQPCRIRCPAMTPVVFKSCGGTNNFCERSIVSWSRILYSLRNASIGSIEAAPRRKNRGHHYHSGEHRDDSPKTTGLTGTTPYNNDRID
jgi:hypothetical protein